ncbi:DUF222 domain-containing protein, partial [Nocardia acidivorans]|uniref:DUF222 domain-containing protein n=1 Tax=Nocardia acidivorans TaxID=404580 RepID=UPI0035A230E8
MLEAAAQRDGRSPAQRTHDALLGVLRFGVDPAMLGTHRGLPVATVLTMNVDDVERGVGIATTATGGTLSISEALKLSTTASDSSVFVAVLNKAGAPIHLTRLRRTPTTSRSKTARTGPIGPVPGASCHTPAATPQGTVSGDAASSGAVSGGAASSATVSGDAAPSGAMSDALCRAAAVATGGPAPSG